MSEEFSVTLIQCPSWGRETPPVAISLLGGNLKSKGFKVHLFDLNNEMYHSVADDYKFRWSQEEYSFWSTESTVQELIQTYDDLIEQKVKKIAARGSRIVGFTLYFTTTMFTREIIKRLKRISPETIIVVGGPSTAEYAGGMDFLSNPDIDAIVLREGDETLPQMCADLRDKGSFSQIPGLVFKKDGEIINGGLRDSIPSLDALAFPDYSDFDLKTYAVPTRLDIFSSRSCVNQCHFCDERKYFGRFRIRSGQSLFEEVQHHLSRFPDVSFFNFSDSVVNGSLKTLRDFSQLLLDNNVQITWGGQGIVRKDMSPELLSLMKQAGCLYISYGIESGSNDVLRSMNKGRFTIDMASKVLKDTHDSGINAYANFMFGFPTETEDDFEKTLDFISDNHDWIDGVSPSQSFIVIVPNTYLHDNPGEFGVEENMHHLYWQTEDGSNTYPVRFQRYERFCKLCIELGLNGVGVVEEKIDKWKLLGSYYRFRKDYDRAMDCYKNDLLKHGYTKETLEYYLESVHKGEEQDSDDPFQGIDTLVTYYNDAIKFLKDQIVHEKTRHEKQTEMLRRNIKKRDEEILQLNGKYDQSVVTK